MRPLKVFSAILALTLILCPQAHASEEDSVRAAVNGEAAAWAKYDAKAVVSFYVPDATWQNPFGVRTHNTKDLERFLSYLFQRPGYRAQKEVELPKITIFTSLRQPLPSYGQKRRARDKLTTTPASRCSPGILTTLRCSRRRMRDRRSPNASSWMRFQLHKPHV